MNWIPFWTLCACVCMFGNSIRESCIHYFFHCKFIQCISRYFMQTLDLFACFGIWKVVYRSNEFISFDIRWQYNNNDNSEREKNHWNQSFSMIFFLVLSNIQNKNLYNNGNETNESLETHYSVIREFCMWCIRIKFIDINKLSGHFFQKI